MLRIIAVASAHCGAQNGLTLDTQRAHYVTDSRVSLCWFIPSNPKLGSFCSVEAEAEREERKRKRKARGKSEKGSHGGMKENERKRINVKK